MKSRYPYAYLIYPLCALTAFQLNAANEVAADEATAEAFVLPSNETTTEEVVDEIASSDSELGADDDIFTVLPQFTVSTTKDRGYYSANSLAGTRTNQLIKDTPMTISVVNQEMLDDLNLTEIDSLSQVVASVQSEGESFSNRLLRFRGLLTRFQLFEFMPRQGAQNGYNVDRVEVVRGANSLVYGQAAPGGKANFLGKKGSFSKDFGKVEVEYGENSLFRGTIDYNKVINDKLAVRVMATHQEKEFDQDFKSNTFDGATVAVAYRPTDKTTFNFHLEYFDEERVNPKGVYKDRTGDYGLSGILQNLPATPDVVGFLSNSALNSIINYNDGTLEGKINNSGTLSRPPQLNIDSADDLRRFYGSIDEDNSGTISGPDVLQLREGFFVIADMTHQFSDNLSLKVAYAHEELTGDNLIRASANDIYLASRNKGFMRNESQEPNTFTYDGSDPATMPSPYMTPFWQTSDTTDDTDAVRTTLSWNTEIKGSKQQFLLGLDYDRRDSTDTQYQEVWSDTTINADGSWAGNARAKDYFLINDFNNGDDNGIGYTSQTELSSNFNPNANMGNNGRNPISNREGSPTFMALQRSRESVVDTKAIWLANQGSYFNGRLNTLLGVRFDVIDLTANTDNIQGGNSSELDVTFREASPSAGVLFWLNENIGFFANYAESIESPNGWALSPEGDTVPPELGVGYEGGIKFEFLDGKISGQLIYFDITKENDRLSNLTNAQLERLYPEDQFGSLYDSGSFNPLGRNVSGINTNSTGVELDLYYNPTPSLSLFLGYAYVDAVFDSSPTDSLSGADVLEQGQRVPGTAHHSVNFTARYNFKEGILKGWYTGANVKYRSKSYYNRLYQDIGSDGNGVGSDFYDGVPDLFPLVDGNGDEYAGGEPQSFDLWLDDTIETAVFVGWRGKLFDKSKKAPTYSVQLTVQNVFDQRDLVATGNNARYTEGRRASIKASVQF